jgi:hypothetical protein
MVHKALFRMKYNTPKESNQAPIILNLGPTRLDSLLGTSGETLKVFISPLSQDRPIRLNTFLQVPISPNVYISFVNTNQTSEILFLYKSKNGRSKVAQFHKE